MSNNLLNPNELPVTDSNVENISNLDSKKTSPVRRSKYSNSRSSNTPIKPRAHKRISSQVIPSTTFDNSSPCRSRFDYTSVPDISVDLKACQNDIYQIQLDHKHQILVDQRKMQNEWIKAKKNMKKMTEKSTFEHEEYLTTTRLELKKMVKDQEKTRKIAEQQEKILDFLEVRDAKKLLKEQERLKELEYIKAEREKAILRQKEVIDRKEKLRIEREEKRKAFLESIEAIKQQQIEEKLRIKRELEYEYAQELAGKRKILMESFESHKNGLMKVEMILSD